MGDLPLHQLWTGWAYNTYWAYIRIYRILYKCPIQELWAEEGGGLYGMPRVTFVLVVIIVWSLQENAIDFNHTLAAALLHNIERHGWCYHAATPLYDSSLPTVEKALLAMEALRVSCDFTPNAARLQELTGQFQEVLKAEGEDEFIQILLQLCSKQLHWIRQSNKELWIYIASL